MKTAIASPYANNPDAEEEEGDKRAFSAPSKPECALQGHLFTGDYDLESRCSIHTRQAFQILQLSLFNRGKLSPSVGQRRSTTSTQVPLFSRNGRILHKQNSALLLIAESWAWQHGAVIFELERWRQEDQKSEHWLHSKFKASLGCLRTCLKTNKQTKSTCLQY